MSDSCGKREDGEGFTVVSHKGRGRSRVTRVGVGRSTEPLDLPDLPLDKQVALRRIVAAKKDFESSDYCKSFLITLEESLAALEPRRPRIVEILCFGLGHIGDCMVSRYQLALVLRLKDKYDVPCLVHDPIFYTDECEVLRSLGLTLIRENEEGKRSIRSEGITIVYMPHCPKQLTNNFLWKNWGTNLKNCVLLSNSFTSMIESQPRRFLDETVSTVLNIYSYTQEFSLVNSFQYRDIFNDLSIHIFPESVLSLITDNFWSERGEEPEYGDDVELITKRAAAKLKIVK